MTARTVVPMPTVTGDVAVVGAEIEPDLSAARRRAERIRLLTMSVAENVTKLRELVHEAKEADDHLALGYPSWTAYLADLFGDEPLRLARDVRRELVAELHEQGMSTRAIAPIVGVDQATVSRDIARDATASPEPETFELAEAPLVGYDSRTGELTEDAPRVTGLDGRSYPRESAPRALKLHMPRPLADDAADLAEDVGTVTERLLELVADERFDAEKAEIREAIFAEARNAAGVARLLLDRLGDHAAELPRVITDAQVEAAARALDENPWLEEDPGPVVLSIRAVALDRARVALEAAEAAR